jgi:hypothetical protein
MMMMMMILRLCGEQRYIVGTVGRRRNLAKQEYKFYQHYIDRSFFLLSVHRSSFISVSSKGCSQHKQHIDATPPRSSNLGPQQEDG